MLAILARAVRERRVSAAELVGDSLRRIDRMDEALHSVVRLRAEEALAEAAALDRWLTRSGRPAATRLPLIGVPFLVKDVEDVRGLPTTHASLLFADAPPASADSGTVARLRAAGAIPIGKTNTSEFAFEGVTHNRLFEPSRNPWNLRWSPGGSSGGSAAALAAGLAPIATGTDAGGSVRGPAAVCGLVGLKPTNGLVGRPAAPEWLDLVTDGAFGTSAADIGLLLGVMQGPWPGDMTAAPGWRERPKPALPRRLIAARRLQAGPLPPDIEACFRRSLHVLEGSLRIPVEEIPSESIFLGEHHPDDDSLILLEAETIEWLGRSLVLARRGDLSSHFAVYLDDALGLSLDAYVAARRRRFDHARRLDELLGADAVLVTPTLNVAGSLADGTVQGASPEMSQGQANTNPQNVTGHPALSVPAGLQANGMPFGLQFTGPRYRDDLLLRLAAAWQEAAPWPAVAPGYEPFETML